MPQNAHSRALHDHSQSPAAKTEAFPPNLCPPQALRWTRRSGLSAGGFSCRTNRYLRYFAATGPERAGPRGVHGLGVRATPRRAVFAPAFASTTRDGAKALPYPAVSKSRTSCPPPAAPVPPWATAYSVTAPFDVEPASPRYASLAAPNVPFASHELPTSEYLMMPAESSATYNGSLRAPGSSR